MVRIPIKSISLNSAYRGRRFATDELKDFKEELAYLIPKSYKIPKGGKLAVKYIFGLSSKNADLDNQIKATQDSLAEYYGFNDKMIYSLQAEKVDVKKGEEFIEFEITNA